ITGARAVKRVAMRRFLAGILRDAARVDRGLAGRTLVHEAVVGLLAGLMGAGFFAALEGLQQLLLEGLGGYHPLRAHGETFLADLKGIPFRPWLLVLLPALGALAAGAISPLAPETRGGGREPMIVAFQQRNGLSRQRVARVKAVAPLLAVGRGGSDG